MRQPPGRRRSGTRLRRGNEEALLQPIYRKAAPARWGKCDEELELREPSVQELEKAGLAHLEQFRPGAAESDPPGEGF